MKNFYGEDGLLEFELGEYWQSSKQNQYITVLCGGYNVTSIDNLAYLPTFYARLLEDIEKLKKESFLLKETYDDINKLYHSLDENFDKNHQILAFDITNMSARCYFINADNESYILFSYWDRRHKPSSEIGKVFKVVISQSSLLSILESLKKKISTKWY